MASKRRQNALLQMKMAPNRAGVPSDLVESIATGQLLRGGHIDVRCRENVPRFRPASARIRPSPDSCYHIILHVSGKPFNPNFSL